MSQPRILHVQGYDHRDRNSYQEGELLLCGRPFRFLDGHGWITTETALRDDGYEVTCLNCDRILKLMFVPVDLSYPPDEP